jgi:hypothetical protein
MTGGLALLAHAIGEDEAAIQVDRYVTDRRTGAALPLPIPLCHLVPPRTGAALDLF